jgi:DNA-binding XRE family transcriptional regulator
MARTIEMERRRDEVDAVKVVQPFELILPSGSFDLDTGRRKVDVGSPLVHVGRYFRRSRAYAGLSQAQLAAKAGVSQSMVSRTERARAPAMGLERFVDMCVVLGRLFPLGACPHDHECGWQPIRPTPPLDDTAGYIELLLGQAEET